MRERGGWVAGRIVLTAGLWFRACPLEGAINPGLSGPGCVSSPLNELILNATEKKRKCKGGEWEREREREWLFNSPSARSPHPVPPRFSIQDCCWKGGGEKSRNTETVTSNKPRATRPPHVWFKQEGNTQTKYIISNSIQHLFSHPSNFSLSALSFYISTREMRHIVKKRGRERERHRCIWNSNVLDFEIDVCVYSFTSSIHVCMHLYIISSNETPHRSPVARLSPPRAPSPLFLPRAEAAVMFSFAGNVFAKRCAVNCTRGPVSLGLCFVLSKRVAAFILSCSVPTPWHRPLHPVSRVLTC